MSIKNIFFQSEKLNNIKNLEGIYFETSKDFKIKPNMIKIKSDTLYYHYNPEHLKYTLYIDYDKETNSTYITIVKED